MTKLYVKNIDEKYDTPKFGEFTTENSFLNERKKIREQDFSWGKDLRDA